MTVASSAIVKRFGGASGQCPALFGSTLLPGHLHHHVVPGHVRRWGKRGGQPKHGVMG